MRTLKEIEVQIDNARQEDSSRFPGMTYEQGVENALMWVIEQSDVEPMTDD